MPVNIGIGVVLDALQHAVAIEQLHVLIACSSHKPAFTRLLIGPFPDKTHQVVVVRGGTIVTRTLVDVLATHKDGIALGALGLHPRTGIERSWQVVEVNEAIVAFHNLGDTCIGSGIHSSIEPVVREGTIRSNEAIVKLTSRLLCDNVGGIGCCHMAQRLHIGQLHHLHDVCRIETRCWLRVVNGLWLSHYSTNGKQCCNN